MAKWVWSVNASGFPEYGGLFDVWYATEGWCVGFTQHPGPDWYLALPLNWEIICYG